MDVLSKSFDSRIKAYNILVEFSILDYLDIAKNILKNNTFQRKRVKASSSVYSLLREDLKAGCTIPPLVLALSEEIENKINESSDEWIAAHITQKLDNLLILDGLQRTYTLIDVEKELKDRGDEETINKYYSQKLRLEIYLGINKLGILYRMLTLNTGQSPMSLRHQMEILYSDYLGLNMSGVTLIREVDEISPKKLGEYKFNDVVEGFTSYMLRDELTSDRGDLLENIKSLEKLSQENQDKDLFQSYFQAYHKILIKINALSENWIFDEEESELSSQPFGTTALKIFGKPQVMTGFGASIGFLKDRELINAFEGVLENIELLKFNGSASSSLDNLVKKLDQIRLSAKKIGNAQRIYFYYFFRELFNSQGDSFLVIDESIENGFKKYRQNE